MRKLAFLALLVAFSLSSYAQTLSFSLVTPPCNDNGILRVNMSGLTPPITVSWYTYGTTSTTIVHTVSGALFDALSGYSGGPVYVYATDGTNAVSNYYSGAPPFTYALASTPEICPTLGSLTVTATGGTSPYTYQWYNTATAAVVGSGSPVSLAAGSYGVIITDAGGCVYGSQYNSDTGGTIAYVAPYTITLNATSANCTNGTASVTGISTGATLPVSYHWTNGATTSSITGLSTGTYGVIVTDALGCTSAIDSTSIYVPQTITINVPTTPTPATCIDTNGTIIAFGSGGTPPYAYLWSNGAVTQSQTGLASGYYTVNVTDANGCIGSGVGFVSTSTPITVTYTTNPSLCTSPSGNATVAPAGGTAPYEIMWYTTPPQTGVTATALAAGTYDFKVTDNVGCTQTGTVTVPPVDIISLSFTSTPALCTLSTGSMNVTAVGGVTPYTYSWSTGATTSSISSVPSGTYGITVTDNLGCKVTKYPFLSDYSPMSVGLTSTPASCIFTNDGIISATAMGGTAPYSYGWSSGGTTATITGLSYGPYWMNVTDATGCTASDYTYLPYNTTTSDCYCTIEGTVYNDTNSNCTQDTGEVGISNIQVYCSGIGYTYTDAAGHYSFLVPTGTYTVSETVLAFYPLAPCQSNSIVVSTTAATGCINTINFANIADTIHDIHISTWDYNQPVIGNVYTQVSIISNDGTVTEDSVLAAYKPDGQLFAPAFTPSGIFNGAPYYYNTASGFPSLAPGGDMLFYMNYNVPTNIPTNTSVIFLDSVAYKTPMSNWLTDYSPWNNVNYFTTTTVAAYDPNFKEVSPKGVGPTGLITYADSTLEYMVHFQNTGTAPAQNIIVVDTLDNNLNWTSLRPVYTSAPCKVTMQQVSTYKIVKFTFSNINLPTQASSAMGSNGMFTYTIKTNSGLPLGTQFRNHAAIYFDYNAPVLTNTTLNTLGAITTGVKNTASIDKTNSFSVYPNPANREFYASINSSNATTATMYISDITGKILIAKTIALQQGAQNISTDVSQLAPGMYFVNLNQNGKIQTAKLVIMK